MTATGNINKRSRFQVVFYLLIVYVIFQFVWWSVLIVRLNKEIYRLKTDLIVLAETQVEEKIVAQRDLDAKLSKRMWMTAGEGSVFLILIGLGLYQLRKSVKKEAALTKQQNNFLLSVTHELKSPLASTRLQLETLLKRELPKDRQQQILSNAINDTDRLNALIENILLAASIENSVVKQYREQINLKAFVDALLHQSNLFSQKRELIKTTIDASITIWADATSLNSILQNLLENALKYSHDEIVELSAMASDTKVIISVKDKGPGIPEAEKKNIYNKFYRIGNEETRQAKGTGLGLYIVDKLIKAQNWLIFVKNNQPRGTVFEIHIPNE